jgi:hypothetical protein
MTKLCLGCGSELSPNTNKDYCFRCVKFYKKIVKLKPKKPDVTSVVAVGMNNFTKEKLKEIRSRVLADDGKTVLKGQDGIDYMEAHAEQNPAYAQRLKEYYST